MCKFRQLFMLPRQLLFLFLPCLLVLAGCAAVDRRVGPDERISLTPEGNRQGTYEEVGITLRYTYGLEDDVLSLQGNVTTSRSIEFVRVHLLFIDQRGNIIGEENIYRSGYRTYFPRTGSNEFDEELQIPEGAVAISFDIFAEYRTHR